jgi:hypothetical protein
MFPRGQSVDAGTEHVEFDTATQTQGFEWGRNYLDADWDDVVVGRVFAIFANADRGKYAQIEHCLLGLLERALLAKKPGASSLSPVNLVYLTAKLRIP